jgi:hypothetical protein
MAEALTGRRPNHHEGCEPDSGQGLKDLPFKLRQEPNGLISLDQTRSRASLVAEGIRQGDSQVLDQSTIVAIPNIEHPHHIVALNEDVLIVDVSVEDALGTLGEPPNNARLVLEEALLDRSAEGGVLDVGDQPPVGSSRGKIPVVGAKGARF